MLLKAFLDYLLLEKKYSQLTVNAYKKDIETFLNFVNEEDQTTTIKEVHYSQIRSWIVSLVQKDITNRSINRKISALNSFYKFLLKIEEQLLVEIVLKIKIKVRFFLFLVKDKKLYITDNIIYNIKYYLIINLKCNKQ